MAKRFGGKFSPDLQDGPATGQRDEVRAPQPQNPFRNRRVAKPRLRANLLFFVPLPLLFSGIGELRAGDAMGMIGELGALGLLLLAPWLLREGLKAEDAYNDRKIARPPAIPRKAFAAVVTGAGVALAGWLGWGQPLLTAALFGVIAAGAHVASFGLDPMKKKGIDDTNAFDAERAAKAIDKAEATLAEIDEAARRFGDRALEARIDRLGNAVREMFKLVEEDPRDLTRARKFLGVYLNGARDATVKFADIYARDRNSTARDDYVALIDDLESKFNAQSATLLLDDRSDLDIEIEVLRERIQQEGLRAR